MTPQLRLPVAFACSCSCCSSNRRGSSGVRRCGGYETARSPRQLVASPLVAALSSSLLPFLLSDYHRSRRASRVFFIAILGLNILTGYTGQISIGHGAFMAIGGYTTAILRTTTAGTDS